MKERLKNLVQNVEQDRVAGSGDSTVIDDVTDELSDENEDWLYVDIFFDNLDRNGARKLITVLDDEAFDPSDLLSTTQMDAYGAPDVNRYGRGINAESRVNNMLDIRDYETHAREQPYLNAASALPLDQRLRSTLSDITALTGRAFRF